MHQRENARSSLETVINFCTEIVAVDDLHTFCTYKAQPIRGGGLRVRDKPLVEETLEIGILEYT